MKDLICIVCPKGCHLKVDEENGYAVTGNGCERGAIYGANELRDPRRVVTSTVCLKSKTHSRLPVKTVSAIPKSLVFDAVKLLDGVRITTPVNRGDVILSNVLNTGVDFVAARTVEE